MYVYINYRASCPQAIIKGVYLSCSFGVHDRHSKRRLADLPLDICHDRQSVIALLLVHGRLEGFSGNHDVSSPLRAMAASSSASGGQPPKEPQGGVALPPSAGTSTHCAHGFRDAKV